MKELPKEITIVVTSPFYHNGVAHEVGERMTVPFAFGVERINCAQAKEYVEPEAAPAEAKTETKSDAKAEKGKSA